MSFDEEETEELPAVRMGPLDIPIYLMSFLTGTTVLAGVILGDITCTLAKHSNYLRERRSVDRSFREIVRGYDHSSGIGSGRALPPDGYGTGAEAEGSS